MKKILSVYKPIGFTPLQLIQALRKIHREYDNQKLGFAGRLDPLAHGVMLLMIGSETKNRDKYLGLSKTYEFEVLFGVSTDTYDVLGILSNITMQQPASPAGRFNNLNISPINLEKKIKQFIDSKLGKQIQPYPPYSSIEVGGKPLYQWAREAKLDEIQIPEKEIEILEFKLIDISKIPADKLHKRIIENINTVEGDFRQEKIKKSWEDFFSFLNVPASDFSVAKFRISCSSGTYVRSLAHELGNLIGTGAIALSILRTKVGTYKLEDSIRL